MAKKKPQKPQRRENQHTKGKNRLFSHPKYDYNKRREAGKKAWETRRKNEEKAKELAKKIKSLPKGEITGLNAHDKYDAIMRNMSKSEQKSLRMYQSGDFLDAADYMAWEKGRVNFKEMKAEIENIRSRQQDINTANKIDQNAINFERFKNTLDESDDKGKNRNRNPF